MGTMRWPALWVALCTSWFVGAQDVRAQAVEAALVEMDLGSGRVTDAERAEVAEALAAAGVDVLAGAALAERWSAGLAAPVDPEARADWLDGVGARAAAMDLFFANEFALAVESLEPWLLLLEREPALLALHPDLAAGAFDVGLTLARAHEALGDEAAARAALQRAVSLAWFAEVDAARYPPSVRRGVEEARALTPVRTVRIDVRGGSGCELRVNGQRVESGSLALPASPQLAQARCDGVTSRVHRVPQDRDVLTIDVRVDDAVRDAAGAVSLAPRGMDRRGWSALLGGFGRSVGVEAVATVAWVEGEVGGRVLEVAWLSAEGTSLRAARVDDPGDTAALRDAAHFVQTGERDSAALVTWTEAGTWEGLAVERRRVAAPVLGGVTAAAVVAAGVAQGLRARAARDVDACADDLVGCGLSDRMLAERATLRRRHRAAVAAWSVAGASAAALTTTLVAQRGQRDARVSAQAGVGRRAAVASVRVLF